MFRSGSCCQGGSIRRQCLRSCSRKRAQGKELLDRLPRPGARRGSGRPQDRRSYRFGSRRALYGAAGHHRLIPPWPNVRPAAIDPSFAVQPRRLQARRPERTVSVRRRRRRAVRRLPWPSMAAEGAGSSAGCRPGSPASGARADRHPAGDWDGIFDASGHPCPPACVSAPPAPSSIGWPLDGLGIAGGDVPPLSTRWEPQTGSSSSARSRQSPAHLHSYP